MRGLTVFFDTGKQWQQMLEVFQKSWERHMSIPLEVIRVEPPDKTSRLYGLDTNTSKLELWREHFDQDTIFCDCDMLVRADITEGFDKVRNVGFTERTSQNRPFNAGVIFARHTNYSIDFFDQWCWVNKQMYKDNKLRQKWEKVVPGMNQPALAYMLDNGWQATKLNETYNMCDADRWKEGKMVHIKSESRNVCFESSRRFLSKEYQKSLYETFWSYLGGTPQNRRRNLIEVKQARRRDALRARRKNG